MDRRALPGIIILLAGLIAGVAALAFDLPWLGALAGVLAVIAGGLVLWFNTRLGRADSTIDELSDMVAELQDSVERESRARAEVETKLSSRIQLTAVRRSTEADALTDGATGLFSEGYFTVALDARISAARRNLKPVAVVLMEVIEGLDSGVPRPADPHRVAAGINETIRDSDTACRLLDGGYALVLEDTTENGAIWTVERIRRALAADWEGITLWAGVAGYPAHGLSTEEVLDRADLALDLAREWRQDRIEVASAEN